MPAEAVKLYQNRVQNGGPSIFETLIRTLPKIFKNPEQMFKKIKDPNLKKVILVKNPVDRLFSVFMEKFKINQNNQTNLDPRFHHLADHLASCSPYHLLENLKIPPRHSINFADFIHYFLQQNPELLFQKHEETLNNKSWLSLVYQCLPCNINIDSVLKVEDLGSWSDEILDQILFSADSRNRTIGIPVDETLENTSSNFEEYKILPPDLKEKLSQHFRWENDMFGYDF